MKKFLVCKVCGNLVGMLHESDVPMQCCGEQMTELVPNTVDAAKEKHVPVIKVDGDIVTVNIGEVPHPMLEEHYITWIYLETKNGGQRKILHPGDAPTAKFRLIDDEPVAAYEYCNLHGLWKAEV